MEGGAFEHVAGDHGAQGELGGGLAAVGEFDDDGEGLAVDGDGAGGVDEEAVFVLEVLQHGALEFAGAAEDGLDEPAAGAALIDASGLAADGAQQALVQAGLEGGQVGALSGQEVELVVAPGEGEDEHGGLGGGGGDEVVEDAAGDGGGLGGGLSGGHMGGG